MDILLPSYGIHITATSLSRQRIEETTGNKLFLNKLRLHYITIKKEHLPALGQWINVMDTILYSGVNVNKVVTGMTLNPNIDRENVYFSITEKQECESLYFHCKQLQTRGDCALRKIKEEIFGGSINERKSHRNQLDGEFLPDEAIGSNDKKKKIAESNKRHNSTMVEQLLNDVDQNTKKYPSKSQGFDTNNSKEHKKAPRGNMVITLKARENKK